MDRFLRSWIRLLTGSIVYCLLSSSLVFAASDPKALETILRKIEARHYRWVAIRAEVLLFFAVSGNSRAMCGGELLYQRLDERMLLPCVDSQKNLVFVFRTFDDRFDLYLPGQKTIYHGSIFDMEDSPDIESHLKPRDLYRALKPSAFDPAHTDIERDDSVNTTLNIYDEKHDEKSLKRRLYLAPEGDVLGEIYYATGGQPLTQIQRYDFREIPADVGSFHSIIFPKKITIVSPATQKGSALFFANVKALDFADPLDFILRVPLGTKEVFLEEKNPRQNLGQPQLDKQSLHEKTDQKNTGTEISRRDTKPNSDADADFVEEATNPENSAPEESPTAENGPTDQVPEPEGPLVQYPKAPEPKEDTAPKKETSQEVNYQEIDIDTPPTI